MLSVQSTIPGANALDVYIDGVIKLKFSAEVATVSLAKTIFNLYSVTGTAPNEVFGAAAVTYSKNPADTTEVWVTPQGDLLSNQKYMLMVKGDPNTNDAIKVGVLSTTNEVMSGNYILYFTTGNKRAPAPSVTINVTPSTVTPVDPNATTTYQTVDGFGNITTPLNLEVIGTEPEHLFNVTNLTKLRILFNKEIMPIVALSEIVTLDSIVIDSAMPLNLLTVQSIEVSGNYIDLVFGGQMASSPDTSGTCISVVNDPLVPGSDGLANNHKHRVLVNAGSLQVIGSIEKLAENFQIEISTGLFPYLCSIYETRAFSRGVLTEKVTDDTIGYFIFHNSKMIMDRFGLFYNMCSSYFHIADQLMFYFQQYVRCQSIYDAGRTLYNITDRFRISSKSLGDMSIGYANPSQNTLADPISEFQKCAEDMWTFIMAKLGASVKSPVKSLYAETNTYPGRFRTEFLRRPLPDPNHFRDRVKTIRYFQGYPNG
jgi:hypothetical protein